MHRPLTAFLPKAKAAFPYAVALGSLLPFLARNTSKTINVNVTLRRSDPLEEYLKAEEPLQIEDCSKYEKPPQIEESGSDKPASSS